MNLKALSSSSLICLQYLLGNRVRECCTSSLHRKCIVFKTRMSCHVNALLVVSAEWVDGCEEQVEMVFLGPVVPLRRTVFEHPFCLLAGPRTVFEHSFCSGRAENSV